MADRKNAKSCYRCRALRQGRGAPECELGHPIDMKTCCPKEPCEKPLTYLDYMEAIRDMREERARRAAQKTGKESVSC